MADEEQQQGPGGEGDMQGGSDDARARDSAARDVSEEPPANEEEELREQLEEEIRRVRVEDVVLQSVVSILNLSARRIAKDDERDLEQAKVGIDAGRALVELVKPDAQAQLRQAISELQLLYAKYADEGAAPSGESGSESAPEQGSSEKGDSGLWTPPGS